MNVEELLDMLEETLEEGTAVPFAAAKRVVDVDRCRDIVDEVRNNLPDELRDSKKIVADREQILKNAQTDADNIIKQAEERARVLVSDKEITKRAQKMAVELVNAAQAQAKKINNASAAYCENILKNSEEVLARSVADIKNTRMNRNGLRPPWPTETESVKSAPCAGFVKEICTVPAPQTTNKTAFVKTLWPAALFGAVGLLFAPRFGTI